MANKKTSIKKQEFLNPQKPLDCVRSFIRQGMSKDQAMKHCDSLWKQEEGRRDAGRTVSA